MTDANRPLLITADPHLLDDVVRLAAVAGVDLTVRDQAVLSAWSAAPVVLVGDDLAGHAAAKSLPRREGVIVMRRADPHRDEPTPVSTWQAAVALGAEHVAQLPEAERWVVDRLAQFDDAQSAGGPVISCVPAVGGAGASTLAAVVAREAGGLLVDADPFGAAVPVEGGVRWPDLAATRGRIAPSSLRSALPSVHGVHVLTGTPDARFHVPVDALVSVLSAGSRGFPCTVVDTPRGDGDATRAAWSRSDLVAIVVGPHPSSAARLPAVLDAVREVCAHVVVVARTSPRDAGTWCAVEAPEWGARVLPAFRHERPLASGEHAYLAPRSTGRATARAILAAVAPGATR